MNTTLAVEPTEYNCRKKNNVHEIYIVSDRRTGRDYHWTLRQLVVAMATGRAADLEIIGTIEPF